MLEDKSNNEQLDDEGDGSKESRGEELKLKEVKQDKGAKTFVYESPRKKAKGILDWIFGK